jgi:hypothetical protein
MADEIDDLDRLLARVDEPAVPPALRRRILADFDRLAARPGPARLWRRAADAIWPGVPAWQPAAALALALLIGFGVAIATPLESDGGAGAGRAGRLSHGERRAAP